MCYSPEADLVAGLVVGAIGIDAFRRVDDRRDMALAAVPIVLAAHQLIEAVAWRGLQGRAPEAAGDLAVGAYLIIALGIVPILVPFAVLRTERDSRRRAAMIPLMLLGVGVSFVLLLSLVIAPYGASIGGRYIAYDVSVLGPGLTGAAYAIAVCAPLLLSSHRRLVVFGFANVPVVAALSLLLSSGLISLWCVWAAVSSLVVARHVRDQSPASVGSGFTVTDYG